MPKKEEVPNDGSPWVEDDDTAEMTDSTTNSGRTVVQGPPTAGAKSKSPPVPNIRLSHPDNNASFPFVPNGGVTNAESTAPFPLLPTFRYASHSSAKGAHTLLRKKIYAVIAQKGDFRQVEAMGAELIAIGKEIKQHHDMHVRGCGEMTFSDEEEENDWIKLVNKHHKECMDAAYLYVSNAKKVTRQGASASKPETTVKATAA